MSSLNSLIVHTSIPCTGIAYQIAKDVYNTSVKITILEECKPDVGVKNVLLKFRLDFDNREYFALKTNTQTINRKLPSVPATLLLSLFPFGFIADKELKIIGVGEKLYQIYGSKAIIGKPLCESFRIRRPKGVPVTWTNVSSLGSCFQRPTIYSDSFCSHFSAQVPLRGNLRNRSATNPDESVERFLLSSAETGEYYE